MSHPAQSNSESVLPLWLTFAVEADYRKRAAFPGLRMETAAKRSGTQLLFNVPLSFARDVLEDAAARANEMQNGRERRAFVCLRERLQAEIDRAEGVCADPGLQEWKRQTDAEGVHPVGAVLFHEDGRPLTITKSFGVQRCVSDDGDFRDEVGRFDYRPGYIGTIAGDDGEPKAYFCAAGELYDKKGGFTHLRLVRSA